MTAVEQITQSPPLATVIDGLGHRVTVRETRSGMAAILTETAGDDRRSGQPCLTPANALELAAALTVWANLAPEGVAP